VLGSPVVSLGCDLVDFLGQVYSAFRLIFHKLSGNSILLNYWMRLFVLPPFQENELKKLQLLVSAI
jgi:hypothetical protein